MHERSQRVNASQVVQVVVVEVQKGEPRAPSQACAAFLGVTAGLVREQAGAWRQCV